MKKTKYFAMFTFMLIFFAGISHADYHILIDHTCTDLSRIPATAISQAKSNLHIAYQHTSHGSQLITGMNALASYPDFGDTYAFSDNGISGLRLFFMILKISRQCSPAHDLPGRCFPTR